MPGFMHGWRDGTRPVITSATITRNRRARTYRFNKFMSARSKFATNKVITNRAEKKHEHNSIDENAAVDQNGALVKLSPVGIGSSNHDRIGSYCRPISIVMRWSMLPGSPNFTLVRMILFQFNCDDDVIPPTSADVLENTLVDTNNQLFSPYKQDNNNTRVLWDKMSWVAGETGSSQRVLTGKVMIPGKKIRQLRFNRGGSTSGSGMIYLLLISSRLDADAQALKPNFLGTCNIRFTDT